MVFLSCEHVKTKQTDNQQIADQNPLTMHEHDGDLDDRGMLHEEREYMWGDYVTPHPPIHPPHSAQLLQLPFPAAMFEFMQM